MRNGLFLLICMAAFAAGGCQSPLESVISAVDRGDTGTAESILAAHPEFLKQQSGDLNGTPLHKAAGLGNIEVVKFLLAKGADVNSTDLAGRTPLAYAIGIRSSAVDLGSYEYRASDDMARTLIDSGADVTHRDTSGSTALHDAARMGRPGVAKVLVAAGADIHAIDTSGYTPLHIASREASDALRDCEGMVRFLTAHGADVNAKDSHGNTPLHIAAGSGPVKNAKALIEAGADLNARNSSAMSPLHALVLVRGYTYVRADRSNKAMAELLINAGADINARDNDGLTPFGRAKAVGWKSIMACLKEHGGIE